ncbi:MAG TPA: AraD1 family protein [Eudoraea sp.]|nr:AraD1 family protein [Eudoraea sp.]
MRLVQILHKEKGRKVALVEEPVLRIVSGFGSIYELARQAIENDGDLSALVIQNLSRNDLEYDPIYQGVSDWKLLPSFDHPTEPLALMLSGTGLTHKASAENRQKMHKAQLDSDLTDSMKMYLMGVEGGRPSKGRIGVQPEWFYKGNGTILRAHGEDLEIPSYGNDGGEEPEVAGVYINDRKGNPWRLGFTTANEFSDHIMERKNYLYLAPSKIRHCSIGPELVIATAFEDISGKVSIHRNNELLWERAIKTGESNMAHNILNLEYHHFKYENHAVPGQCHIHFFGADAFSFGEELLLKEGDIMKVAWQGMGRPLRNRLVKSGQSETLRIAGHLF